MYLFNVTANLFSRSSFQMKTHLLLLSYIFPSFLSSKMMKIEVDKESSQNIG